MIGLGDEQLDEHLAWASKQKPTPAKLLEHILGDLAARKIQRRITMRLNQSGLKDRKTLEGFDWTIQPKLDRVAVEEIAELNFIERKEDFILTGKTGTGKSHILKALAWKACLAQYHVRYTRCVDLIDDLYAGLADDTYERKLNRYCRAELLILDDVGLGQLKKRADEPTAAHMLFNLVDLRHQHTSTALSSNIKLSAWGKYLGDATLAAAILDRLAMNAIRIDIDGPSYRQHIAKKRAAKR